LLEVESIDTQKNIMNMVKAATAYRTNTKALVEYYYVFFKFDDRKVGLIK